MAYMETINENTAAILPDLMKVRHDILNAVDHLLSRYHGDSLMSVSDEGNRDHLVMEIDAYYESLLLRIDDALYDAMVRWS